MEQRWQTGQSWGAAASRRSGTYCGTVASGDRQTGQEFRHSVVLLERAYRMYIHAFNVRRGRESGGACVGRDGKCWPRRRRRGGVGAWGRGYGEVRNDEGGGAGDELPKEGRGPGA
jgi:hypothetical protein